MKDLGIQGVQNIDTSNAIYKGFFGFRKLFQKYLRKLHVPFIDDCCAEVKGGEYSAVRYNTDLSRLERYDSTTKAWVAVA